MKHNKFNILAWVVVATVLLAGWATSQVTKTKVFEAKQISFCIVGDSNSSWGTPQFYYNWWQCIDAIEPSWTFNSVAQGGARAVEDGVQQIQDALLYDPDYIIVALGTNDVWPYSVAEIQQAYSSMEREAGGVPVIFLGPIEIFPWNELPDTSELNNKIAQLQVDIPMLGVLNEEHYLLPVDGVHVDGQGSFDWGIHVRKQLKAKFL